MNISNVMVSWVGPWVLAGLCTIGWLFVAFSIAYPQIATSTDLSLVVDAFLAGRDNERTLIPFLVCVDIVIALMLGHMARSTRIIVLAILCAIIYIYISAMVISVETVPLIDYQNNPQSFPQYSGLHPIKAWNDPDVVAFVVNGGGKAMFTIAVACLFVPRFCSFLSPPTKNHFVEERHNDK